MNAQNAFENYLLEKMASLCPTNGKTLNGLVGAESRLMDELRLFDPVTPFERVASTLGHGTVTTARMIEDAPPSLRISVEHRYSLPRWPAFDFVILESEEGIAWGQTFARRARTPVPPIHGITDLARWSHVESEVRAELGAPESHEAWSPWESAVYRVDGRSVVLCYVYGLLQNVRPADTIGVVRKNS